MLRSLAFAFVGLSSIAVAQDRLPKMPRYELYRQWGSKMASFDTSGRLEGTWDDAGNNFFAMRDGRLMRFNVASGAWSSQDSGLPATSRIRRRGGGGEPQRGRQYDVVTSPDGKWTARSKGRNVVLESGGNSYPLTTAGSAARRIKYGIASWVYGEELEQSEAMWFSPDSSKLAFYKFDESKVPDYYVALNQTGIQDALDVEAYPKAGAPNPIADIVVCDVKSRVQKTLDLRSGGDSELSHYVYNVHWSPDGSEVLFFRMNRLQNTFQYAAANVKTGVVRAILTEHVDNGWVPYKPGSSWTSSGVIPIMLENGRFLWVSERSGYRNVYLYDLSGKLVRQLTHHDFDVHAVLGFNDNGSKIWYTAYSGDASSKQQLHVVDLQGNNSRLTDPTLAHEISLNTASGRFVDIAESYETRPSTRLCDPSGKVLKVLATSDAGRANAVGLQPLERITATAADGKSVVSGFLMKPSDFDPNKRYPLLVSVYGGPESGTFNETYGASERICEMGFLVATLDGRGTWGRGRDYRQAVYGRLGGPEIDDQAAGVQELCKRPYVDGARVGIFGTSYGGYASLMAILRYPGIFKAAAASSPVTDWRNYDSTYTERYMGLPEANQNAYEQASCLPLVKNLKGRVLLFFGSADNNVHPSNVYQLIREFDRAGKGYSLAVGPDAGHAGVDQRKMLEFFVDQLGGPN